MITPTNRRPRSGDRKSLLGLVFFAGPTGSFSASAVALPVALLALATPMLFGQNGKPEKLTEIPDRLFQVQDAKGFFWQLTGNGAITSGETQYLQSGLNLLIDDAVFAPTEAVVRPPGQAGDQIDAVLTEERGNLNVVRNVWLDIERSGVRVLDSVKNSGADDVEVTLSLRTTYPFGWQSLHDTNGDLLSAEPSLKLDPEDEGLTVHFNPSEGRHDTIFITGASGGGQVPLLKGSTNSRELTFRYPLVIKSGETVSVFHWIAQRNLSSPDMAVEELTGFMQRNQLIAAGISGAESGTVANFPGTAFADEAAAPSRLRELLALNELTDEIGWHRRRGDVHWLGQTNQISGELVDEGSLTISGVEFGERTVPLKALAAIKGGNGTGYNPFLYLRNGEVLTGQLAEEGVSWKVGESVSTLEFDEIRLLLLGTGAADGAPPEQATHFVKFRSGVILAVDGEKSDPLKFHAAWGGGSLPLKELRQLTYSTSPSPGFTVHSAGGSLFPAYLSRESLSFSSVGSDEVTFPSMSLDTIWKAGATTLADLSVGEQWIEFAEIPRELAPDSGFLLNGNTILAGGFVDKSLELIVNKATLSLACDDIVSMKRVEPEEVGNRLRFEVLLKNGDKISSTPVSPLLRISSEGKELEIPAAYLQSYRGSREGAEK